MPMEIGISHTKTIKIIEWQSKIDVTIFPKQEIGIFNTKTIEGFLALFNKDIKKANLETATNRNDDSSNDFEEENMHSCNVGILVGNSHNR